MPDRPSFDRSLRGDEVTQVDAYLTRVRDRALGGAPAPARPDFTVVLRGYDRAQVDRYLDELGRDDDHTRSWAARHFSQANPRGPGQGDVPALLRRVADSIEKLGPVEVQDIVFQADVTEDGAWPSLTVCFHAADDAP